MNERNANAGAIRTQKAEDDGEPCAKSCRRLPSWALAKPFFQEGGALRSTALRILYGIVFCNEDLWAAIISHG